MFADDAVTGGFAALDLADVSGVPVVLALGDAAGWRAAGLDVEASANTPSDTDRIDFLFWNHDRHEGNFDAMRAYLRWETELPGRIHADGTAGFRVGTAA